MKFPKLQQIASSRQTVDVFGGYNHNLRIGDGEWYDMKNMTSDYYPVMSPRGTKNTYVEFDETINGVCVNNVLCMVVGTYFVITGRQMIQMGFTDGPKTLVSMGAYVIILPDKKWVNVAKCLEGIDDPADAFGDIERKWSNASNSLLRIVLAYKDGTRLNVSATFEKPTDPEDGAVWADTTEGGVVYKKWYADLKRWMPIELFLKVIGFDEFPPFEEGDEVVITSSADGVKIPEANQVRVMGEDSDGKYIVIDGVALDIAFIKYDGEFINELTMERTMPDMDFIIESGNRLWGCKYGITENGFVNEIYASKLGDFKNWNSDQGISTDSYVASIGADGPFTGAVCYRGRPVFFKEDCMIEVYGAYPAQYQVQTTSCTGVQEGCEKSLAIVNNILYYKAPGGICAFDGSLPVQVGQALGQAQYEEAVACGYGSKYYISMRDVSGAQDHEEGIDEGWSLFVFDATKGLWHREDETHAAYFFVDRNKLFYVPKESNKVIDMECSNDEPVEWMVQSGEIGLSLPDMKYLSRLTVRMSLEEGSEVSFYVQYDFEEEWVHICTIPGTSLRSFDIPIRPKRCDHMKLRIEGVGGAKIYSITKTIEQGSDIS